MSGFSAHAEVVCQVVYAYSLLISSQPLSRDHWLGCPTIFVKNYEQLISRHFPSPTHSALTEANEWHTHIPAVPSSVAAMMKNG